MGLDSEPFLKPIGRASSTRGTALRSALARIHAQVGAIVDNLLDRDLDSQPQGANKLVIGVSLLRTSCFATLADPAQFHAKSPL